MNWRMLVMVLGGIVILAHPANAVTLTNADEATYSVVVVLGVGDGGEQNHELAYGDTLRDICGAGCTIRLSNGTEEEFEGDESVTIRDGEFVTTE